MAMRAIAGMVAVLGCAYLTTAQAADVVVMSAGAVKGAFQEAAGRWSAQGGTAVHASFAPAGELRKRMMAHEAADILVMPAGELVAYEREGEVVPGTRRDLGVSAMGAAVRQGDSVPDISTPEALRRALLAAKSVTYMDPALGSSGKHFDESVLPALGIRDAVRAKAVLGKGGSVAEKVAQGEAEIAFQNVTELLPVAGVTMIGLLPAELQKPITYSGAVLKSAKDPRAAQSLLDYLASPAGRKSFLDRGFTAPK
jgi:molybdate transport system substrate-binding protein